MWQTIRFAVCVLQEGKMSREAPFHAGFGTCPGGQMKNTHLSIKAFTCPGGQMKKS